APGDLPSSPAGGAVGALLRPGGRQGRGRRLKRTAWHLITGAYPPQPGGVSDYTHLVASGLAEAGDMVHVWCPPAAGEPPHRPGSDRSPGAGRPGSGCPAPGGTTAGSVPYSPPTAGPVGTSRIRLSLPQPVLLLLALVARGEPGRSG